MTSQFHRIAAAAAFAAAALVAMPAAAQDKAAQGKPASAPMSEKERVGYTIGMDIGRSLKPIAGDIDVAALKRAIDDMLSGAQPRIDQTEAMQIMQAFSVRMQERQQAEAKAQSERNAAAGQAFLAENGKKAGVITTASGLQYQVLKAGQGAKPTAESTVRVHYTGTLLDGTQFDSSRDRGEAATFVLGQVIAGWTEGLQLMQVGSSFRFWIPAALAYGDQVMPGGPIPPGSTLVFDVELLEVL